MVRRKVALPLLAVVLSAMTWSGAAGAQTVLPEIVVTAPSPIRRAPA